MDILFWASFVYLLLIAFIFFGKKKVENIDTKLYSIIIIINIVGLLLNCLQLHFVKVDINRNVFIAVNKVFLIYTEIWTSVFAFYILNIGRKSNYQYKNMILSLLILSVLGTIFLPENYKYTNTLEPFVTGPSVYTSYIYIGILIVVMSFSTIRNFLNNRTIKRCNFIPLFVFIFLGLGAFILQRLNPSLWLISPVETFVTILMYFFIENPDMKMIEELNIARDQAEKANRAKSEFLSNMSHEIRTPLNAIVGFSQALQEENLSECAKEEVQDIISASNSLLEIVNGILDISKIEAHKLEIVNTEYSFRIVFNDLVTLIRSRISEKNLEFRVIYDESIPRVLYGDYTRVKQIILNLLTNAVKYTREGYVEFRVSSVIQGDICRLIISVEDSGIGIKRENIDKLFNKFERLDLENNITIEGTGLGLAITKKLVDLMHGKIVVQSVYGKGSKFTVAIDQKIMKENESIVENKQKKVTVFDASLKRVLIVDDNKINLKVASRLLMNYKIQIETVESGFACIEKIKSGSSYDLILMDDMMPKMSGTETLHQLRALDNFKVPVVALTANAISGMREKYLSAGFDDYLSKPIDKLELSVVLKKYLGK